MDLNEYWILLGRLVGNLLSLEFTIRAFLNEKTVRPGSPQATNRILDSLKVGDVVPVNPMTDFSTLGQLIKSFNMIIEKTQPELQLDYSLVAVRDAIAHGRVSTSDPTRDFFLLKFSHPSKGAVTTVVSFAEAVSSEWLKAQIKRVYEEVGKICRATGTPIISI